MRYQDARVLVIDDDEDVLISIQLFLKRHFKEVRTDKHPRNLHQHLKEGFDVLLLDMNFQTGEDDGREGLYWLKHLMEMHRDLPVIMMTAYGEIDLAVSAIKLGAFDFILKPFKNEKLLATLQAALKLRRAEKAVAHMQHVQQHLNSSLHPPMLFGASAAMQQVYATIEKVASTDANVLILGENGTGKELVARSLHQQSHRGHQAFIGVDLGAINEQLFESELFGHVKGAFTDAHASKEGRFQLAQGGTLFLDEIGNLSLAMQAKLLRVLQNREVQAVGSPTLTPIDIRLISATNMPLYEMVEQDGFRQDLLYRINTVEITLPPLRDRPEDIPMLAQHFLALYAQRYRKAVPTLQRSAIDRLKAYPWPGNVRELQHCIERTLILHEQDQLDGWDLQLGNAKAVAKGVQESLNLKEMESALIEKALEKHKGNISKAAQELGLTRAALYRRLDKHDLQ